MLYINKCSKVPFKTQNKKKFWNFIIIYVRSQMKTIIMVYRKTMIFKYNKFVCVLYKLFSVIGNCNG